jgi:nucleoside-diphosphate-sugar epimerase
MKKRVLVLGASGFIGKRIVNALAASDWATPIAASRHPKSTVGSLIETLAVDATNESALKSAMTNVDAVVNCVAGNADAITQSAKILFATAGHMTASPRVVHLSSLAAYGSTTGPVDEAAPLLGDLDAYSAAKATAEKYAANCENWVILRPGIVYGPGSAWWSDRIARLLLARRLGDLGKFGAGLCNLVHVDDVVAAVLVALRQPNIERQAFNLSMPNPPTWNEYFVQYGQALGLTQVPKISPIRLTLELKAIAIPLKLAEIVASKFKVLNLHPAPAIRPWLITLCQQHISMQTAKAETLLGLRWIPLNQGLKETANWFIKGGRA